MDRFFSGFEAKKSHSQKKGNSKPNKISIFNPSYIQLRKKIFASQSPTIEPSHQMYG
jgi:hypothetical protein